MLSPDVLFLPGWGFSGQVLDLAGRYSSWARPALPLDPATAVADILAFLDEHHLDTVRLVGWSLGAALACDFACAFPEKSAGLTLLGLRASWPASEIGVIRQALAADPPVFLQDFYRKSLMGYKNASRRFAAEQQVALIDSLDLLLLERGLDYLAQWRVPAGGVQCPVICWHGRRDIIAPVAERAMIPGARITVVEHGGHALFLDREFAL